MDADAAQPDRPAVEKKLRSLPFDPAEADAVGDGIGAECQGGVVELRGLGRPELGRPVEARLSQSASDSELAGPKARNLQPRGAVRGFGKRNLDMDAALLQPEVKARDAWGRHTGDGHFAKETAVVEPVHVVHRHAVRTAGRIDLDHHVIPAGHKRRGQIGKDWREAAPVQAKELAVQEDAGAARDRPSAQDQAQAGGGVRLEIAGIPGRALVAEEVGAREVPASGNGERLPRAVVVVARNRPVLDGGVVEGEPALPQPFAERVEHEAPFAVERGPFAAREDRVVFGQEREIVGRLEAFVVEMGEGVLGMGQAVVFHLRHPCVLGRR